MSLCPAFHDIAASQLPVRSMVALCAVLWPVTCRLQGRNMDVQVLGGLPKDVPEAPEVPRVQGNELQGGPQMLQLS